MLQTIMEICHFPEFGLDVMAFVWGAPAAIGWLFAYFDLVRLGFKQKTYGMPMTALALNLVWEFVYAYMYWTHDGMFYGGYFMAIVNTCWAIVDVVILITHIKYGKEDFVRFAKEQWFHPYLILNLVMAVVLQITWLQAYGVAANGCTAIIQNIPMSMLFIFLLCIRKSTKGQSMAIAIGKMVGTMGATAAIAWFDSLRDPLNVAGGIICFVFDMIYCVMLYKQFQAEGKNPWHPLREPEREPDPSKQIFFKLD